MKIRKHTFILLLLTTVLLPLLGNKDLIDLLHINLFVNITNYILHLLLIISIIIDLVKYKYKPKLNITTILVILFIISLFISLIFSITYQGYNITNLYKFIIISLFIFIIPQINLKEYDKTFNRSIIVLSIIICLYGIAQYIFNFQLTLNGVEKYPGAIGRIKSTLLIATILDKFIVFNLIYLYYLLFNKKENKWLLLINIVLCVITLALTFSRSGLIIFVISSIALLLYSFYKKKFVIALLIIISLIGIYFIPGQKYVTSSIAKLTKEKLSTTPISFITNKVCDIFIIDIDQVIEDTSNSIVDDQIVTTNDASKESRDYFGSIASAIMFKYPYTGIGIGSYNYIYGQQNASNYIEPSLVTGPYLYPHSMYLQLGAEIGIIGLVLFIGMIISTIIYKPNIFSILLLLGILIASLTETIFYIKDISYFTIIINCLLVNNYIAKKEN